MTQQEFETRTGLKVTEVEFAEIHNLYMDMPFEKDEFCEEYKNHGESKMINALKDVAQHHYERCKVVEEEKKTLKGEMMEAAIFLLGKAEVYDDIDFYHQAISLIGQREVIMQKLHFGYRMNGEDKRYIKDNLK